MSALTGKKARFVEEYLKDLNATQAAIRAEYSEKTAYSQGQRLLKNVEIQKAIEAASKARSERTRIDSDYVLHRLAEIDRMDVIDILADDGSLKPVRDWPPIWRQYIGGMDVLTSITRVNDDMEIENILKKIKWPDKVKNLELIGKHVDVQAWRERQELTGPNGGPVETVTRIELVAATGDDA
ncbi:terminase small subunit [uncultured Halomonas sp.]|uniref:terminase small subunit n=1 Tax=uncultured Halomonas sp. TaxID=173971 RepID=UPI0026335314|nr:terminase small subunit [uncultured Halomonas sp.]